jgi:DNA mismatch repair protein MLH3
VIIDQHAADERIKLEILLDEYETVKSSNGALGITKLDNPIEIPLDQRKKTLIMTSKDLFKRWGIHLNVGLTVSVTHVPNVVVDQCGKDKELIIDTIIEHLQYLEENLTSNCLHRMPLGLLDLFHSRACR